MNQIEIINYCNKFLKVTEYKDYCPNGLQLEGDNRDVKKVALAVSVTEKIIEKAIAGGAELLLAHHGLFWNKDTRVIKGANRRRLKLLFDSGLAVAGYHLPLDFHSEIGNNSLLAKLFGLKNIRGLKEKDDYTSGVIGESADINIDQLASIIEKKLDRKPLVLPYGPQKIKSIGIISGGAQGYFNEAIEAGVDCFITGEASEYNYSLSMENSVHFISAGHYQTETVGIKALGEKLADEFKLETFFISSNNPI